MYSLSIRSIKKGTMNGSSERSRRDTKSRMKVRRRGLRLLLLLVCCVITIGFLAVVWHSTQSPTVYREDLSSVQESAAVTLSTIWSGCLVVLSSLMKGLGQLLQLLKSFLSNIDYSYHVSIFREMYARMPVVTVILLIGGVSLSFTILLFLVYGLCKLFLALSDKSGDRMPLRESSSLPAKSQGAHAFDFNEGIMEVSNLTTTSISPHDEFSLVLFVGIVTTSPPSSLCDRFAKRKCHRRVTTVS